MTSNDDQPPQRAVPQRRSLAHDARLIAATLILAGLAAFALDNRRSTPISWVVGSGTEPLALLLAGAAISGALIGGLSLHRPHHRHD